MTVGFLNVKWLHLTGELDKCIRFSCQIFAGFNIPKICTVNFRHTYSKNKKVNVIGTQCICCLYHPFGLQNCQNTVYGIFLCTSVVVKT